jgi:small subunit ribosomal protein S4
MRLDNVVYRLGFASTRAQARQFVSHGHVLVDGRRVTIPSYGLRPGQTVSIASTSPVAPLATAATELTSAMPGWLQVDFDRMEGRVVREPLRSEITAPVNEQLIVEFYSRR